MRVIRAVLAAVAVAALFVVVSTTPSAAQTTTTSSVPSLPVTGTGPTTTTTAPATGDTEGASETAPDLATTGIDADVLLKLGVLLVLLGAAVQIGERTTRAPEPKLTLG